MTCAKAHVNKTKDMDMNKHTKLIERLKKKMETKIIKVKEKIERLSSVIVEEEEHVKSLKSIREYLDNQ